jgi:hypothetical protein
MSAAPSPSPKAQSETTGAAAISQPQAGSAQSTAGAENSAESPAAAAPNQDRRQGRSGGLADGVEKRKNVVDRRAGLDRRVVDIGSPTGLERRRGPGRRRTDDRRSAEEGEMTDEQFEFVMAVDTYKRLNNRPFPTWTEVLEVVKQLGYRKVAASTIKLPNNNGRA